MPAGVSKFLTNSGIRPERIREYARRDGISVSAGRCGSRTIDYAVRGGGYPGRYQVRHTVGMHPCSVDEGWEAAVAGIARFWEGGAGAAPVALGECGLDRFHLPKDADRKSVG